MQTGKGLRWFGMPDREKVIKGLEMCIADEFCDGCPYEENCFDFDSDDSWGIDVMRDALALLKEQETELCDRCGRRRLKSNREGR